MQTLRLEMAIAGGALFVLGVFVATRPTDAEASASGPPPVRAFSQADYDAFDRGFMMGDTPCAVGLAQHNLCFTPSPIEASLKPGTFIPASLPLVVAEFRIIVETDLKDPALRTVRFGQTLVLADPDTREIIDVLPLSGPPPMSATGEPPAAG